MTSSGRDDLAAYLWGLARWPGTRSAKQSGSLPGSILGPVEGLVSADDETHTTSDEDPVSRDHSIEPSPYLTYSSMVRGRQALIGGEKCRTRGMYSAIGTTRNPGPRTDVRYVSYRCESVHAKSVRFECPGSMPTGTLNST